MQWIHVFLTCTRQLKLEHCNRKWNYFLIVQWSKNTKYQTFRNVLSCKAPTFPFWGIFHYITHFLIVVWWLPKCPLSILERCPVKRELLSFCKPSSNHLATQPPLCITCLLFHYCSQRTLLLCLMCYYLYPPTLVIVFIKENSSLGFAFFSFSFSFCFEKVWGAGRSRWWKRLRRYLFVQTTTCHAIANRIQSSEFDGNI